MSFQVQVQILQLCCMCSDYCQSDSQPWAREPSLRDQCCTAQCSSHPWILSFKSSSDFPLALCPFLTVTRSDDICLALIMWHNVTFMWMSFDTETCCQALVWRARDGHKPDSSVVKFVSVPNLPHSWSLVTVSIVKLFSWRKPWDEL